MTIRLTDHAQARLQQRGIPIPVLECLLTYGRKVHDHRGGELVFLTTMPATDSAGRRGPRFSNSLSQSSIPMRSSPRTASS